MNTYAKNESAFIPTLSQSCNTFYESSLRNVKTKNELRPNVACELRNLLNRVEAITFQQGVLYCSRKFGITIMAAIKLIQEIARVENIYLDSKTNIVSLHKLPRTQEIRNQALSFWTFVDFLPEASDIICVESPFVHSYFVRDMFVETAVFPYGSEAMLLNKIRLQYFPDLTPEAYEKRRRIAIVDSARSDAAELIKGCGFTHVCHVELSTGEITPISQVSAKEAWEEENA